MALTKASVRFLDVARNKNFCEVEELNVFKIIKMILKALIY